MIPKDRGGGGYPNFSSKERTFHRSPQPHPKLYFRAEVQETVPSPSQVMPALMLDPKPDAGSPRSDVRGPTSAVNTTPAPPEAASSTSGAPTTTAPDTSLRSLQ